VGQRLVYDERRLELYGPLLVAEPGQHSSLRQPCTVFLFSDMLVRLRYTCTALPHPTPGAGSLCKPTATTRDKALKMHQ